VYDPSLTFLTYGITLQEITPPSVAGTKLTIGSKLSGNIRNYGDQHSYILDGIRGSTISLTLPNTTSGVVVCADVYDPLGALIAGDCYYRTLTLRLSVSGSYPIVVREGSMAVPGMQLAGRADYAIAASCLAGCSPVKHPMMAIIRELPVGVAGTLYPEQKLLAFGGFPAYSWSIESGDLPPGIAFSEYDGVLSGTPERAGRFDFLIKIADRTGQTLRQAFSILITARPFTCRVESNSGASVSCGGTVLFSGGYGAGGGRGLTAVVLNANGDVLGRKHFDTWLLGPPAFQDFLDWISPFERGSLIYLVCGDDCAFWRWTGSPGDPIEQTMRVIEGLGGHFVRAVNGGPNVGYRDSYAVVARKGDGLALAEGLARYSQSTGWANLVIEAHFPLDAAPSGVRTIDPTTLRILNETSSERRPTFRVNDRWLLEVQNTQPNSFMFFHFWRDGQDLGISGPYGRPADSNGAWTLTGVLAADTGTFWNMQAIVGRPDSQDRSNIIGLEVVGQ